MEKRNKKVFQGARLRLARTLHGYSMADLGGQISVTRQYIQRLEVEPTISPKDDIIAALAETLQVEETFFFEPLVSELHEEACHFRKLKTTPLNIRKRALAYGTIFNSIVAYFDYKFELPKVDFSDVPSITATAQNREDIERIAEKCRVRWGLKMDAPIHNMIRTIERAGAVVTTFEGVSQNIDAFSYINSRPIVVRNTAKISTSRARFDLAHELGHLVLHQDLETDDPRLEDQANHFASAFLLPRVAFIREFPKYNRIDWTELLRMKTRWGASLQAIIRRAYDLRIISAVQYRNANVYISRNGWRTDEPGEEVILNEIPEIIPTGFELLRKQGIYPNDVAYTLHISPLILEKYGITLVYPNMDPEKVIPIEYFRQSQKKLAK